MIGATKRFELHVELILHLRLAGLWRVKLIKQVRLFLYRDIGYRFVLLRFTFQSKLLRPESEANLRIKVHALKRPSNSQRVHIQRGPLPRVDPRGRLRILVKLGR